MEELKVLTWNIRHCEKDDGVIDVMAFIREAAKANADVVLLQEVDRGVQRSLSIDQVVAFRNELGPGWVPIFSKRLNIGVGIYGIATFTKLPVLHSKAYLMADIREEKCVTQEVTVDFHGTPVKIYNFHMPEGVGPHTKKAWRRMSKIPFEGDCIIAGDFNVKNLNEMLTECEDIGSRSTSRWGRIDYCVSRGNIKPVEQVILPCRLSDHYPVLTTFRKTFDNLCI